MSIMPWQGCPMCGAPSKFLCKCPPCDVVPRSTAPLPESGTLSVEVGCMEETNGRKTWIVLLKRSADEKPWDSHQVYADEIQGRAEYEAARLRHFLGLGPEPDILAFDTAPAIVQSTTQPTSGDFKPDWANYKQGRADGAAEAREVTEEMVNRFLQWRLPKDFAPDCGISFDGRKPDQWNADKGWPVGTNLLTAAQARAMLEHVLEVQSTTGESSDTERLNWLFAELDDEKIAAKLKTIGNCYANGGWIGIRIGDFRHAIDAARAAAQSTTQPRAPVAWMDPKCGKFISAAEAAKQQARRDAEICREQALCSEDEAHDNSVAAQDGDGTSCNKGTQHCAQAIEREAGL